MISANAMVSPQCPTGVRSTPVRMPGPVTQWHDDAVVLWTGSCSPWRLNGTHRVSPHHRPISTGSVPDSNPAKTGWWTIGLGLRETKPAVYEWGVFGEKRHCFWTSVAFRLRSTSFGGQSSSWPTVGAIFPRSNAGLLPYGCLAGSLSVRPGEQRQYLSLLNLKPRRLVSMRYGARTRGNR